MAERSLTLVARQPILEVSGRVHAHELLFRGEGDALTGGGERATAAVLVSTFLDARLDEVTAGKPVWINVSREFLLAVDPLPFPPARVVLELLEDQYVDDAAARPARDAAPGGLRDRAGRLRLAPLASSRCSTS